MSAQPIAAPPARAMLRIDALRAPFVDILAATASRVHGWTGALVATVDGRLVAVHHTEEMEAARVSAMVGSVVALGDTVCRELKYGRSQSLIVSAGGGHLLALRIPASREVLVLGVLARNNATLGLLIHHGREAAVELGACFDRLQAQALTLLPAPSS
jgi:uncharacterized protein